jgi:hypothetical protein
MLNVPLAESVAALSIRLMDASGSLLSTWNFTHLPKGTWQQQIPLEGKASMPGIYLIHVSGLPQGKSHVLKILKTQ